MIWLKCTDWNFLNRLSAVLLLLYSCIMFFCSKQLWDVLLLNLYGYYSYSYGQQLLLLLL